MCCCKKSPKVSSAPGLGSNPRAEPQRRRPEHRVRAGEPLPWALRSQQRGARAKGRPDPAPGGGSRPGTGMVLSSGSLIQKREEKNAAGQLREAQGDPIPRCSERGRTQPSCAVPFVLLHLHPYGVELPLAPALCVRVGDGLDLPRGRGRALEGGPEMQRGGSALPMLLRQAQSWLPADREERSPPGHRWRGATSAAEPSSSAPPGQGWP